MFRYATHTNLGLRFKRWSRKSYAVFASLNKVVSIASLVVSVANQSVTKLTACGLFAVLNRTEAERGNEEAALQETSIAVAIGLQPIVCVIPNTEVAAAAEGGSHLSFSLFSFLSHCISDLQRQHALCESLFLCPKYSYTHKYLILQK